ncbi:hypothetical protein M422DRAFT_23475 [Sphaerobolus stellatus SS14]|nr:hypothetical protein M422DRAFT_23475 [Sphaerobolus stellatus SS14]
MSRIQALVSRAIGESNHGNDPNGPIGEAITLTQFERTGIIVMAVAGVLSCAFVSCLLLYIFVAAGMSRKGRQRREKNNSFISKHIAIFITCLLFSDLIQSIAGLTQVKWAMEGKIYDGRACKIQASTLVMGDLGSTIWSCVIAAHTFSGIALNKPWSRLAVWMITIGGWLFVIVLTFIAPLGIQSASKGPYYSIAGTWCFISSEYAIARLIIHYIPLFIAAVVLLVFYIPIFLVLRGSIGPAKVEGAMEVPMGEILNIQRVAIAKRMLWYPAAFLVCILPIAVTRLAGLREQEIPEQVWIISMFFLFSLGFVDAIIYAITRNVIKPINMPIHMATLSGSGGGRTLEIQTTTEKRREDWTFKTQTVDDDLDSDDIPNGQKDEEDLADTRQSRENGIQVTFERVQYVI